MEDRRSGRKIGRAAVAALTLALAAAAQAPSERWYTMRDGPLHYGAMHELVTPREDGGREWRTETRILQEVFGTRQEHRVTTRVEVDARWRLVSFATTIAAASGEVAFEGTRTENGIRVVERRGGETKERLEVVPATDAWVVDAVLPLWLHRLGAEGRTEQAGLRVLSTEAGALATMDVRRVGVADGITTWELTAAEALSPTHLRIDGDGTLVEQSTRLPPQHLALATAAEAASISHRTLPEREVLVFRPAVTLPMTSRVERVVVELTWRDIPPDAFELTDNRQRVLSQTEVDGVHTTQIELRQPPEVTCRYARSEGLRSVAQDIAEGLAAALGDSDLVLPSDPRIAAKAAEVVGDETSALAASRRLCAWVHAHITPAMIAETLSGPQVLERATGKCTEYSTLFASLARAAGVPTRLALGLRRFSADGGDQWGGHMWNEVFVGEWIAVDASANEVGGSPALVKFVHGDSVQATQTVRWLLTESLGFRIVEHGERPPPAAAAGLVTGLVGTTYTNAEHAFRLELPSREWRLTPSAGGDVTTLRLQPPTGPGASAAVHLVVFPAPGDVAPRALVTGRLAAHRATMPELVVDVDEAVVVGGSAGHRLRFAGPLGTDTKAQRRVTEVVWIRDGKGFLLNLIGKPDTHDAQSANFDALVAGFTFVGS